MYVLIVAARIWWELIWMVKNTGFFSKPSAFRLQICLEKPLIHKRLNFRITNQIRSFIITPHHMRFGLGIDIFINCSKPFSREKILQFFRLYSTHFAPIHARSRVRGSRRTGHGAFNVRFIAVSMLIYQWLDLM